MRRALLAAVMLFAGAPVTLGCSDGEGSGTGTDDVPVTGTAPPSGEGGADTEAGDPSGGIGRVESDGDAGGSDATESGPEEGDESESDEDSSEGGGAP
jgi:hypothetical protein